MTASTAVNPPSKQAAMHKQAAREKRKPDKAIPPLTITQQFQLDLDDDDDEISLKVYLVEHSDTGSIIA
jgi:hypothetical protein